MRMQYRDVPREVGRWVRVCNGCKKKGIGFSYSCFFLFTGCHIHCSQDVPCVKRPVHTSVAVLLPLDRRQDGAEREVDRQLGGRDYQFTLKVYPCVHRDIGEGAQSIVCQVQK